MKLYFTKVKDVKSPSRGTGESAGIDFYVPTRESLGWGSDTEIIRPGEDILIPSGIKVSMPKGHALIAFNKSGVATKQKFSIGACVVDSDYSGEIHLHVFNYSHENQYVVCGQKLVQFILLPVNFVDVEEVDEKTVLEKIGQSDRGFGGFGSTGLQ